MYGRHMKKAPCFLVIRGAAALIPGPGLIFPFATVANTVSANVIDGDQSYTFNMSSTSLEDILPRRKSGAWSPWAPWTWLRSGGAPPRWWSAGRGAGCFPRLARKASWWPLGATRGQALLDNSACPKRRRGRGEPQPRHGDCGRHPGGNPRACQVVVIADGSRTVTALAARCDAQTRPGVTVGEDSFTGETDKPLFDKMHIRGSPG